MNRYSYGSYSYLYPFLSLITLLIIELKTEVIKFFIQSGELKPDKEIYLFLLSLIFLYGFIKITRNLFFPFIVVDNKYIIIAEWIFLTDKIPINEIEKIELSYSKNFLYTFLKGNRKIRIDLSHLSKEDTKNFQDEIRSKTGLTILETNKY